MTPLRQYEIREHLIECLAEVRATTIAEIRSDLNAETGDLVMDSYEAVVLVTMLETLLDRDLPGPEDLEIDQETSLDALATVITRELRAAA